MGFIFTSEGFSGALLAIGQQRKSNMLLIQSYLARLPQKRIEQCINTAQREVLTAATFQIGWSLFKWCFDEERLNDVLEVVQYD